MKEACRESSAELVAQALGISDGEDLARLRQHLSGCPDCAGRQTEAELALAAAALPDEDPPAGGWEKLAARLDAEPPRIVVHASAPPRLRVTLTCTYCHDRLVQGLASYCAACLAPHHPDCFEKHSRCSAPGCTGDSVVRPLAEGDPAGVGRGFRWRRGRVVAAAAAVLLGVAAFGGLGTKAYVDRMATTEALSEERLVFLVAARDLPRGAVVTEDDLATVELPRGSMERALQNTWVSDRHTIIGLRTENRVKAGQVLTLSHFRDMPNKDRVIGPLVERAWVELLVDRVLLRHARARRINPEGGDRLQETGKELEEVAKSVPSALPSYVLADLILEGTRDRKTLTLAELHLRKALEIDSQSPVGRVAQGRLAQIEGKRQQALSHYSAALDADPLSVWALLARAELRVELGDHRGALADVDKLSAVESPLLARALSVRGWARFMANRDRQGGLADLNAALAVDPLLARARARRAFVALEIGRRNNLLTSGEELKTAQADAEQALKVDPTLAVAHRALAWVHAYEQRAVALKHASRAVELGRSAEDHRLRAFLRMLDGDIDHAYLDLEQVLQRLPEDAHAMSLKAAILINRRDYDQARTLLQRAIDIDPSLPVARFSLAHLELLSRPRNDRKAVEGFSDTLALDPTYADAYFYRAVAYFQQGRYEDALRDLDQARGLRDPVTAFREYDAALVEGHCHHARGDWELALIHYRRYLQLCPVGSPSVLKIKSRIKECEQRLSGSPR